MKSFFKSDEEKIQFLDWIGALKSSAFNQTTIYLNDFNGYCCLGVGCVITIPEESIMKGYGGYIAGLLPDAQRHAPQWLKNINAEYEKRTKFQLVERNDRDRWSFKEIADDLLRVFKKDLE